MKWIHNGVVVVTTTIIIGLLLCEFTNVIDVVKNFP